jgi:2-iminobutanoate/2-iminopropanoate deaminase
LKKMKPKLLFTIALLLTGMLALAQNAPEKKKFHWGRESDTLAGYTQAILVDKVLYISGTIGRGNTMQDQLEATYTNLERTLKHYGLGFEHVVKEVLYTTDIEAVKSGNAVRKKFYKGDYPAATWVQITRLFMPGALVEVELTAHLK